MRRLAVVLVLGVLVTAATPSPGGWVVTTVHDLPTHLVAGRATQLTFTLRQHGVERLRGRRPAVLVRGNRTRARELGGGVYEAMITPRDTGTATITIDADLSGVRSVLLPLRVVAPGAPPPTPAAHVRGQALFVAKGCVTCHVKADDPALDGRAVVGEGPELTGRTFPEDWLVAQLVTPRERMPVLELTAEETAALVRYLNRPGVRTVAR